MERRRRWYGGWYYGEVEERESDAEGSAVNAMAAMALSVRLRLSRPATRPSYGWRLWSLSPLVGWGGGLALYALSVATQ